MTQQQSDKLAQTLSKQVAELTQKPEDYVMIQVQSVNSMTIGGQNIPCAFVKLQSIGKITPQANKKYSKVFSETIKEYLNIELQNVYFNFIDIKAENWGWNGSTF